MASRTPQYQKFTQKNGPRQGQSYVIKTGKSGKKIRVYESGDTAIATGKPKRTPRVPATPRVPPPRPVV